MSGKGSGRRPGDKEKYDNEYDRIFGKPVEVDPPEEQDFTNEQLEELDNADA
jgi:hypothetical protein